MDKQLHAVSETDEKAAGQHAIWFGHFCLLPTQRLLLEAGQPLRVGGRAFDILVALIERPGEIVSKDELIARVWPNVFVADGNLKVHVAALRKILRDGQNGNRYVANIPGRGYCFIGLVTISGNPRTTQPPQPDRVDR